MDENRDIDCAGECSYVTRREIRVESDGHRRVEDVERCTGCGRVVSRVAVDGDADSTRR